VKLHASAASLPRWRLLTLVVFTCLSALMFMFLWLNSGGHLPGVGDPYRVAIQVPDAQNLVNSSDVEVAGVKIGKVRSINTGKGGAKAVLTLSSDVAPLHKGATVALRSKTLIEETYVSITDGTGPEIPSGQTLPLTAAKSSVHLDDVLNSLDPTTLAALGKLVGSGDTATTGRSADISATLSGLGDLGRQGHDVLDVLAAQGQDLTSLSRSTTRVLDSLDTGRGQIAQLVKTSQSNMEVVAGQNRALARTVNQLPGTLKSARAASGSLTTLGADLRPVAANLKAAAPSLNSALTRLPEATTQIQATIPSLNTLLDRAPATLTRVPRLSAATSGIVPPARQILADLNPMLSYLQPYGPDAAAFFTNIGAALSQSDAQSHYVRVLAIAQGQSVTGDPLPVQGTPGVSAGNNPYPAPGGSSNPVTKFKGDYPRIKRDSP
jgi:phospholipid/cholesterol/gamma-HCH transport system substrate-binding protein